MNISLFIIHAIEIVSKLQRLSDAEPGAKEAEVLLSRTVALDHECLKLRLHARSYASGLDRSTELIVFQPLPGWKNNGGWQD